MSTSAMGTVSDPIVAALLSPCNTIIAHCLNATEPTLVSGGVRVYLQTQLADRRILSLLDRSVLRANMNVTQPALQRRGVVKGAAASQCEARVGDTYAAGRDPHGGLRALHAQRAALDCSSQRVAPVACCLHLQERLCCPEVGFGPTEFALEHFRITHRSRSAKLLPAGIRQLDEFVHGALGRTYGEGAVRHRKEVQRSLIERPGHTRHGDLDIE